MFILILKYVFKGNCERFNKNSRTYIGAEFFFNYNFYI